MPFYRITNYRITNNEAQALLAVIGMALDAYESSVADITQETAKRDAQTWATTGKFVWQLGGCPGRCEELVARLTDWQKDNGGSE